MGCGPSKSDLAVVQEITGMNKKDAKESFDGFKKQAGGSKIKLDKFTKLVASLNTNKGKPENSQNFDIFANCFGNFKIHNNFSTKIDCVN